MPDFGPISNSPTSLTWKESEGDEHAEDDVTVCVGGLWEILMLKLYFRLIEPLAEPLIESRQVGDVQGGVALGEGRRKMRKREEEHGDRWRLSWRSYSSNMWWRSSSHRTETRASRSSGKTWYLITKPGWLNMAAIFSFSSGIQRNQIFKQD